MPSEPISRSPDLLRLRNEGYEVQVLGAYLLVTGVPHVDSQRQVKRGTLVSALTLAGDVAAKPANHVCLFIGSQPCNKDGSFIGGLQAAEQKTPLVDGLVADRIFSNKPPDGYPDYHAKMTRYITILSDPAKAIDPSATAQTFRPIEDKADDSPFIYLDTSSSRAYITAFSAKFKGLRIAIVGLGGTGAYVLDLVSKTPVRQIHLFDADPFLQHNAFRAPGAASIESLRKRQAKVEYLAEVYSRMHKGIVPHPEFLTAANVRSLEGLDFVFLCMDASEDKRHVMDFLLGKKISFIDCGLGVLAVDDRLTAMVRATTATPAKSDHVDKRVSCLKAADGDYSSNIQIAELNMLNATMAVIKWKKLLGFYADLEHEHNATYSIPTNMLLSEDAHA